MLFTKVGIKSASVPALGWRRLLPDRPIAQQYSDFLEPVLTGFLESMPLAVRHILWIPHDGFPVQCGEDIW